MITNSEWAVKECVKKRYVLRTVKGAKFIGRATGFYYNFYTDQWGLVLTAFDEAFAGTTHVYPATQLEIVP